jgi:uncharacterized protein (DUF1501 family)
LIDLNGSFGLNPSLAMLAPLWQNRTMAFVHASGSPAETRSHFEAQDIMETAMLNSAAAKQGWMNALAQILPDNHASVRAFSVGNVPPKIFSGPMDISSLPTGLRPTGKPVENPHLEEEFSQLYGGHAELQGLYKEALSARESMMQDMQQEMQASAQGAPQGDAFTIQAGRVGEMIASDPRIQLVFMDAGGWDTHVGQGNAQGQLANRLQKFGEGIAAMITKMGNAYRDTTILVMSEFGRTVAENGNRGTDHGHGNVAWVMGGAVRGGQVYGRWPGLDPSQLNEGRDVAITTDFRSIIGAVAGPHFGMTEGDVQKVVPGYVANTSLAGMVAG